LDQSGGALRRAFDDGDFLRGKAVKLVDELVDWVVGGGILVGKRPFRRVFRLVQSLRLDQSGGALRRAFDDGDFLGGKAVKLVDELVDWVVGGGIVVGKRPFRRVFRLVQSQRLDQSGGVLRLSAQTKWVYVKGKTAVS